MAVSLHKQGRIQLVPVFVGRQIQIEHPTKAGKFFTVFDSYDLFDAGCFPDKPISEDTQVQEIRGETAWGPQEKEKPRERERECVCVSVCVCVRVCERECVCERERGGGAKQRHIPTHTNTHTHARTSS